MSLWGRNPLSAAASTTNPTSLGSQTQRVTVKTETMIVAMNTGWPGKGSPGRTIRMTQSLLRQIEVCSAIVSISCFVALDHHHVLVSTEFSYYLNMIILIAIHFGWPLGVAPFTQNRIRIQIVIRWSESRLCLHVQSAIQIRIRINRVYVLIFNMA